MKLVQVLVGEESTVQEEELISCGNKSSIKSILDLKMSRKLLL